MDKQSLPPAAALDPDARRLLAMVQAAGYPSFDALTPPQARKAYLAAYPALQGAGGPVFEVREQTIKGPGGPLALRIYRGTAPEPGRRQSALLYLHGGGWTIGNLDTHDAVCRQIAQRAGLCVIAVDYRLAPEHPFPAALDDAACALGWLHAQAETLGIAPNSVGVAGDSAGGNLAAALALMARDGDLPALACQALIYPALDLRAGSASYERVQRDALLSARTMRWFIDQYAPQERQRLDWRASPLLASSVKGLASALMLTVAHDPLCDEGLAYARRLDEAGVRVTALHLNDQFHGLLSHGGLIAIGPVMTGFVADWLGCELHRTL
jgi:acetyl esterase